MNQLASNIEIINLLADVKAYAKKHGGMIYAPIDHPLFSGIPAQHGSGRFEDLLPHLPTKSLRCLDVGTHWGFIAHRLERLGHEVTAAEMSADYLMFLYRIRSLYGDKFIIWPKSVFSIPNPGDYQLVFALNIFHHFIKSESLHQSFLLFLRSLRCDVMFFQAHNSAEGQMSKAYKNYTSVEFLDLILQETGLAHVIKISVYGGRELFKLER